MTLHQLPWLVNLIGCGFLLVVSMPLQADYAMVVTLDRAEKLIVQQDTPPDFSSAEKVSLPDVWRHQRKGFYGSVWYRIALPPFFSPDQQWALLLPDVNMNAEVWLGRSLRAGSGGSMKPPLARYWHSPLMVPLAASDLGQADALYVRVVAFANEHGRLGPMLIGPADLVRQKYQRLYFNRTNVHIVSASLAMVYAFLILIVWQQRRDAAFLWGAVVCLSWAASSLNLFVNNPPVNELLWEKWMQLSMGWVPFSFYFFVMRLDNQPLRRTRETALLVLAVVCNVVVLFSPATLLFFGSRVWHAYALMLGVVGVLQIAYSWYIKRRGDQLIMLSCIGIIAIAGVHDFLVQNVISGDGETVFWLDYSVIVLLLMVGYLMVRRFLQAVGMAERLNRELEQRVVQAQQRIEQYYDTIVKLEKERASQAERERIYRDIHDDMGGKLLSLFYQAEDDELRQLARAAMDDLRAIVSRKPTRKCTLEGILHQWQREIEKRCSLAGRRFSWHQPSDFSTSCLAPENTQHLRRVLSEAVTNAIKHGDGGKIAIAVKRHFGFLCVKVMNEGDYGQPSRWQEGRGLGSMRHRVARMGGKIRWRELPGTGGYVLLLVPLIDTGTPVQEIAG